MNLVKTIRNHIFDFIRNNDKWTIIFGLVVFWQLFAFMPGIPQTVVYGALALYAFYSLKNTNRFNALYVALILYIPLQLIITNPPSFFRSWERYFMFAFMLCCFSPILINKKISERHKTLFEILIGISVFIGVGSFFARFLGINYMVSNVEDFMKAAGAFGGLTYHSMMLAPIAGIGAIYLCYKAIVTRKWYNWLLCAMCMGSVLFTASRSAFLATLAGLCIMILRVVNTGRSFKIAVSIGLILSISFPLWSSNMEGLINKNLGNSNSIDISSRESKWDARIAEFESDPLFGIGFASLDKRNTSEYNPLTGVIEPGSSWLSVLSMTGIIGFSMVFLMFFKGIINVWHAHTARSSLILGVLTLFMVHMFAEGYIYSGGSILCMALWLTLGCATEYDEEIWDTENIDDRYIESLESNTMVY